MNRLRLQKRRMLKEAFRPLIKAFIVFEMSLSGSSAL